MTFTNQLALTLLAAVTATLAMFGLTPLVQELVHIVNGNVIATVAIGLPILTTTSLLIALLAFQR